MKEFERLVLGKFVVDEEYETYVKAWGRYYYAADQIDGHIKYPQTKEENKLCRLAVIAGVDAMTAYLISKELRTPGYKDKKWQSAKREALRISEKGQR